jgi:hypothetical protein
MAEPAARGDRSVAERQHGSWSGVFRTLRNATYRVRRLPGLRRLEKRPMFQSSLIDDLLFAQPMNVLVRWERMRGHRRAVVPGTTIIVVNFNTLDLLKVTVPIIRRFTPPSVDLMIVDNGSDDGSAAWLQKQRDLRPVLLRTNLGHGRALDIGISRATTSRVLLLDSDAFPIVDGWVSEVEKMMETAGLSAVGMLGRRDRLHPAFALIDRQCYLDSRLSMAVHDRPLRPGETSELGVNSWDCAELFSLSLDSSKRRLLDVAQTPYGGELIAGLVYHHGAFTTAAMEQSPGVGTRQEAWLAAISSLLS